MLLDPPAPPLPPHLLVTVIRITQTGQCQESRAVDKHASFLPRASWARGGTPFREQGLQKAALGP